jgi:hypothetical protein
MCDDDLPRFIMLLDVMLVVKIGVSDHQQAPPSYPFACPQAKMRV